MVAYLFLSLSGQIPWIAITVIVSLVVLVLIVYSSYQIVGLYYGLFFKDYAKGSEGATINQGDQMRVEADKESASRL